MVQNFREKFQEYSSSKNKKLIEAIKLAEDFEALLKSEEKVKNEKQEDKMGEPSKK